jgi:hypothetical protein
MGVVLLSIFCVPGIVPCASHIWTPLLIWTHLILLTELFIPQKTPMAGSHRLSQLN